MHCALTAFCPCNTLVRQTLCLLTAVVPSWPSLRHCATADEYPAGGNPHRSLLLFGHRASLPFQGHFRSLCLLVAISPDIPAVHPPWTVLLARAKDAIVSLRFTSPAVGCVHGWFRYQRLRPLLLKSPRPLHITLGLTSRGHLVPCLSPQTCLLRVVPWPMVSLVRSHPGQRHKSILDMSSVRAHRVPPDALPHSAICSCTVNSILTDLQLLRTTHSRLTGVLLPMPL